jgi:hypothetical protein
MPVRLYGALEMKVKMRNLSARCKQAIVNGVRNFEQIELREMQRRVPVRTGELRDSGYWVEPVIVGDSVRGNMGFAAEHALFVHEDLEAFHETGEAKFMESVLNESRSSFGERVGADVKKELGL